VENPFFIVGSGRCGSTFLYRLLEPHEKIGLTNEARVADFLYFGHQFVSLPAHERMTLSVQTSYELVGLIGSEFNVPFSKIYDRHAREMVLEFYREQFPDKDFSHWGDKLTDPNAALAFRNLFANVRYIVLIRDPRDVICSLRAFAAKERVKAINAELSNLTIEEYSEYWLNLYHGSTSYLHGHHLLRYEDLIAEPLVETKRVLAYLGLELSAEHAARVSSMDSFSGHGTSESVAASSGRWQRELDSSEVKTVEGICGDLMKEHGYELSS
jgi:hypothetical protein